MTSPGSTTITPKDTATTRTVAAPGAPTLLGTVTKTVDADGNATDAFATTSQAPTAGQNVKFLAVVENTTVGHSVELDSLSDSYPAAGGGTTTVVPTCYTTSAMTVPAPALPQTLAPNGTYTCYFLVPSYSPAAGGSLENTVTAALSKPGSTTINPEDKAITTTAVPPTLHATVTKTADADGNATVDFASTSQAPGAGQTVKFLAVVENTTAGHAVQLDSLSDSYPAAGGGTTTLSPACFTTPAMDVAAATLPVTLAANGTYTCFFQVTNYSPAAGGSLQNTVTAGVSKAGSTSITRMGKATTTTAPAPAVPTLSAAVTKLVDADGDGVNSYGVSSQAPSTAQAVNFLVTVKNTSGVPATLASLSDSYGATVVTPSCSSNAAMTLAAATLPTLLAHDEVYTCYFQLAGYSPPAGGSLVNTVTATLSRAGSTTVAPTSQATTTTRAQQSCQQQGNCPPPPPAATCATDPSLCPPPPPAATCATDPSLCPLPNPAPVDPVTPPADGGAAPIGGVVDTPATGEEPTEEPAAQPSAEPVTPIEGVEEEPATAPARPRTLPFTGSSTDALLALAASLSLAGLVLALVGRRRRATS